eukprot:2340845-Alexandrium_andersonii.AAC.1
MKPRCGDGPAPTVTAANPRSAARIAMVAAHLVLGLLALPRPAAPVARTAAATATRPDLSAAL